MGILRSILSWLGVSLVFVPGLVLAEPTPAKQPFSVAFSVGTGYGLQSGQYQDGSKGHQAYFADLRFAMSSHSYLKLGFRTQKNEAEVNLDQYLLLAGFMTTPKPGLTTRGYIEFGAGYGENMGSSLQVLFAAQGGALISFGEGSNLGLDLGLFFVGNFLDGEEGIGTILGAQAGLLVMF